MTDEGDAVLDPYIGVGSAAVAALMHGRLAYGCDIVPEYIETAHKRLQALRERHSENAPDGQANLRSVETARRPLMRVVTRYSHLNGLEYLMVHKPTLLDEVEEVIGAVDALACKTKVSEERGMVGRLLYAPAAMNAAFKSEFEARGWKAGAIALFGLLPDEALMRRIAAFLSPIEQKAAIAAAGYLPIQSFNETDFVKDQGRWSKSNSESTPSSRTICS